MGRPRAGSIVVCFGALLAAATAALAAPAQAPFGDKVSAAISYYNRASPHVGSAGVLGKGGVAEAKALGFKLIIDLRTAEEGANDAKAAAAAAGISYVNVPVSTKAPTDAQLAQVARLIGDDANLPVLINCETANRVGAFWALYRASLGVPAAVAVEEGRVLGLKPSREGAVRARLGLPPLGG